MAMTFVIILKKLIFSKTDFTIIYPLSNHATFIPNIICINLAIFILFQLLIQHLYTREQN